jgi:hypothetical protein
VGAAEIAITGSDEPERDGPGAEDLLAAGQVREKVAARSAGRCTMTAGYVVVGDLVVAPVGAGAASRHDAFLSRRAFADRNASLAISARFA